MAEEHIKVLSSIKYIQIVGIFNRTISKAMYLKKKYKIKKIYTDIDIMYHDSNADGVVVAIAVDVLMKYSKQIFKHPWNCLVEKPLGINYKECKKIVKNCKFKNKINLALNRRFYVSTKYLLKTIKNKSKKKPIIIEVDDQQDQILLKTKVNTRILNNYMFANSIHLIDFFNILCRGNVINIKKINKWKNFQKNIFCCYIYFSSGDIGIYKAVWNMPGPWSVKAYINDQVFQMKPLEKIHIRNNMSRKDKEVKLDYSDDLKFKPGVKSLINNFVKSCNKQNHSLPNLKDSIKVMKLIYNIYK